VKTIIYYFTGTGNSLAAAKKISAALPDCELVPIPSLREFAGDIVPPADRIGIVCPVYFSGLPLMVASFAGRLDFGAAPYVFAVVTHGGGGESAALKQLDFILRKRQGRGLDAGFGVAMPGNYILLYESPKGEDQKEILATANEAIAGITGMVRRCGKCELPSSLVPRILHSVLYPWFRSHAPTNDNKFTVADTCTSCGTCMAICPAKNIELVDKKPVWKHHCELCCGCIHLCPVQAIQAGAKTKNRDRYRHPEVKVTDLIYRQEGEGDPLENGRSE
jgi:Pyruvate/2-oxoacid:ferredoxin oxidoreductase delta subunit